MIDIKNYVAGGAFCLFIAVTVFLTIETVSLGEEVGKIERQEAAIIEENRVLSEEIIKNTSLDSTSKMAQELGFDKPEEILYIGKSGPVAKLP